MEKLKKNKVHIIISSVVILLPILIGLICWNRLPVEIATHFDNNGVPNGWSHRSFAVFGLPLFMLGVHLLCIFITGSDPKIEALGEKVYKLTLWICPLVSWICAIGIYSYALDMDVNMMILAEVLLAVIFILVGNYLPKCRQNYTVGIKLPWTLHSEANWNRTHRLAGMIWVVCGFLMLIHSFVGFGGEWVMIGTIVAAVAIPMVYSFCYYLKEK